MNTRFEVREARHPENPDNRGWAVLDTETDRICDGAYSVRDMAQEVCDAANAAKDEDPWAAGGWCIGVTGWELACTPPLIALPAEGKPTPDGATVVHRECWDCGQYAPCVFLGGWVGTWRCADCIANRWFVADREGVEKALDLMADLATIVTALCQKRWLPNEIEDDDPEMIQGALRAHNIKMQLDWMRQSP